MAAALAGSLATYLFAPARTSSPASVGVAYQSAAPGAVQRGVRVVGPGGQAAVQVPAGVPGQAGVSGPQKQIAAGQVQVVLPPGNVSGQLPPGVVVAGPNRVYFAAPMARHGRVQVALPPGGPAAGQIVAGPGGNWVEAPAPACAFAGPGRLPRRWVSVGVGRPGAMRRVVTVHGRRATVSLAPAPQRVVIVRPPLPRRIVVRNGHAIRVRIARLGGAQRVVIVRPGLRSVRAPRQIRLWLRSGKRLTVVPGGWVAPVPGPGPGCVMIRPPR